jgi:hypothetical protein
MGIGWAPLGPCLHPSTIMTASTWLLAALAGAASLLIVDRAGASEASGCKADQLTSLATQGCANVWPVGDAKFRWPDLRAKCDPADLLCDSAEASLAQRLSASDCAAVRVLGILADDHLARIRCEPGGGRELLINLDSLACHPRNILNYGKASSRALDAASLESGRALVSRAEEKMKEVREDIEGDTRLIRALVRQTDPVKLLGRVRVARHELDGWAAQIRSRRAFDERCEPSDPKSKLEGDAVRAQRTCRLLASSARLGAGLVAAVDSSDLSSRPLLERAEAFRSILARKVAADGPYAHDQALSARMLAFQSLYKDNPGLPTSLKMIRAARESGIAGLKELHAGFVFGGSRLAGNSGGGYDCSDFMTSLLTGHDGPAIGQISTHTLKSVARFLLADPSIPALPAGERPLASCFVAVDLRAGEPAQPGDFVISNNDALKGGHAAIVKRVIAERDSVLTIEAAGGATNTVMTKERPLREPVPQCSLHRGIAPKKAVYGKGRSPVRPDLYVLRLRIPSPSGCPFSAKASMGVGEPEKAPQAGGTSG